MTFVTAGLAIAGLVAMAIPILIHLLFHRRRKPIEWAAMRFLLEAFRRQRRRLQLEQWLLLAMRCLIVALAGAALAQPMLQHAGVLGAGGSRTVYFVIDDGLTSAAQSEGRTALQHHVETAQRIVAGLSPGDSVGLITASRPARGIVIPPSTDLGAIASALDSLRASELPTDLPAALALLRRAVDDLAPDRDRVVAYLLSDFRAGAAALESPLPEGSLTLGPRVTLLASPAAVEAIHNVQVAVLQPLRSFLVDAPSEGATQVSVKLTRSGGELGRSVSQVRLNSEGLPPIEARQVAWEPGQSQADVDFMVDFSSASAAGSSDAHAPGRAADRPVVLTAAVDADALNVDNQRFAVVQLRGAVQVALVDRRGFGTRSGIERLSAGDWIARALAPSERTPLHVVEIDPAALETRELRMVDAAVVPRPDLLTDAGWTALRAFVDDGGVLLITPPAEANIHQWTERLSTALGLPWHLDLETTTRAEGMRLDAEHAAAELLRLVSSDLAELMRPVVVFRWLGIDAARTTAQRELLLADGTPLLIAGSPQAAPSASDRPPDAAAAGAASETNQASSGLVVLLATAPDLAWTNLPTQPLMVPLMQEVVRQGVSLVRASRRIMVGDRPWLGAGRAATKLQAVDGRVLPLDVDGRPVQAIDRSGIYTVLDAGNQRVGVTAVNIQPEAARLDVQAQAAVTAWLRRSGAWELFEPGDPAAVLGAARSGISLAGQLLLAALALLVIETALARWFSHATTPKSTQPLTTMLGLGSGSQPSTAQGL